MFNFLSNGANGQKVTPVSGITIALGTPGRYEVSVVCVPAADGNTGREAAHQIPMSRPVYQQILKTLTGRPPEAGGVLLGPRNNRIVTHFLFDKEGAGTPTSYTLAHEFLNSAIAPFLACDLDIKGLVHSHPTQSIVPSEGDRNYLLRLLRGKNNTPEEFFFPVVCDDRLHGYIVTSESVRFVRGWALPADFQLF